MLSGQSPRLCRWPAIAVVGAAAIVAAAGGCATGDRPARGPAIDRAATSRIEAVLWSRTRPFGRGPAFAPANLSARVAAAAPVGGLLCGSAASHPYGAHVELFAADRVIRVPAGIGVAPPQHRSGALVPSGRCAYPVRTVEPTGVIEVDPRGGAPPSVGDLFALWGQPLGLTRLAGFHAQPGSTVVAYVNGRRRSGDPRSIPLGRHAQIVLEVGTPVNPHPAYAFARGL